MGFTKVIWVYPSLPGEGINTHPIAKYSQTKTENPSNHVGEVRELEGGGVREEFSREWRGRSEERGWRGRSSTRERAGRGEDEGYNSTGEVAPFPSLLLLLLLLLLLMLMPPPFF